MSNRAVNRIQQIYTLNSLLSYESLGHDPNLSIDDIRLSGGPKRDVFLYSFTKIVLSPLCCLTLLSLCHIYKYAVCRAKCPFDCLVVQSNAINIDFRSAALVLLFLVKENAHLFTVLYSVYIVGTVCVHYAFERLVL